MTALNKNSKKNEQVKQIQANLSELKTKGIQAQEAISRVIILATVLEDRVKGL